MIIRYGLLGLLFTVPLNNVITSYSVLNQSQNYVHSQWTEHVTEALPNNSLLFVREGSRFSALSYTQVFATKRTDLKVLPLDMMSETWFVKEHGILSVKS